MCVSCGTAYPLKYARVISCCTDTYLTHARAMPRAAYIFKSCYLWNMKHTEAAFLLKLIWCLDREKIKKESEMEKSR